MEKFGFKSKKEFCLGDDEFQRDASFTPLIVEEFQERLKCNSISQIRSNVLAGIGDPKIREEYKRQSCAEIRKRLRDPSYSGENGHVPKDLFDAVQKAFEADRAAMNAMAAESLKRLRLKKAGSK